MPLSLPWKTCENCGATVPMAHDYELRDEEGEVVKRRLCAACYSKLHAK